MKIRRAPTTPGEILREEFLVPLGLSASALAIELKVPAPRINDIERERRAISADTALRLARYFGTSAEFWVWACRPISTLVGFDSRGIARSKPLRCFGNPKQWEGYFTPFSFPITPQEEAIWEEADRYLDNACDQRGTKIIDHMSTADAARDLDMLCQAVGDEALNYAGYSYGTYLGVTYANLFPEKVRALVVDGVLDPIAWPTGTPGEGNTIPFSTRLRSDKGALDTLHEFCRLCNENPASCGFSGGAASRYAALAASLRATMLPGGNSGWQYVCKER